VSPSSTEVAVGPGTGTGYERTSTPDDADGLLSTADPTAVLVADGTPVVGLTGVGRSGAAPPVRYWSELTVLRGPLPDSSFPFRRRPWLGPASADWLPGRSSQRLPGLSRRRGFRSVVSPSSSPKGAGRPPGVSTGVRTGYPRSAIEGDPAGTRVGRWRATGRLIVAVAYEVAAGRPIGTETAASGPVVPAVVVVDPLLDLAGYHAGTRDRPLHEPIEMDRPSLCLPGAAAYGREDGIYRHRSRLACDTGRTRSARSVRSFEHRTPRFPSPPASRATTTAAATSRRAARGSAPRPQRSTGSPRYGVGGVSTGRRVDRSVRRVPGVDRCFPTAERRDRFHQT